MEEGARYHQRDESRLHVDPPVRESLRGSGLTPFFAMIRRRAWMKAVGLAIIVPHEGSQVFQEAEKGTPPRKARAAEAPLQGSPCTQCLAPTSGAKLIRAKIAPGETSAGSGRPSRIVGRCRHTSAAQLMPDRATAARHPGERRPPRCARPPRPARSAAAPSRVVPRVLPSPGEGLPPVDGIAAVCRAALGGATVGSAIPLRERAWLRTAARVV